MPRDSVNTVRILGLPFASGGLEAIKNAALECRGLVTAPSAPCLALAARDPRYAADLAASMLILPDSGAMVLAWNLANRALPRFARVSGLVFLEAILREKRLLEPGALFLVDPSSVESQKNRNFLRSRGILLKESHQYIAPIYETDSVADPELLACLRQAAPRYVLINLGGGIQERLGAWLQANWAEEGDTQATLPALFCTGAAIAFLTGEQARIPAWADHLYLGWAVRCLTRPGLYIPRYLRSFSVLYQTWHCAREKKVSPKPRSSGE